MTENPFSTQGWNRYAYAGNSPLNFTDPSGYCFLGCFWKPIFKAIGNFFKQSFAAIIQVAATALLCSGPTAPICAGVIAFAVTGVTSGDLGLALRAGATAFFTAAAMDAVGTATLGPAHKMPEFMSPAHVANMAGHALVGCASAVMRGGKCGPGALAGAAGSLAAPAIGKAFPNPRTDANDLFGGTVASAVAGGAASVAGGGKFANGAVTAAFGYLFNATLSTGGRIAVPGIVSRFIDWYGGRDLATPNVFEAGLVFQYPTPTEPNVSFGFGPYLQLGWEVASGAAPEISISGEVGGTKGGIMDTFTGEALQVGGMWNGLGGSVTISKDGPIGGGVSAGSGYGAGANATKTWACDLVAWSCR
jgi:hypothetical protein